MRAAGLGIAALASCAALSGCATTVDGTALPATALDRVLPTASELSATLGIASPGLMGQLVEGDADSLLQGVGQGEATPDECVSTTYQLQKAVYGASPVRSVATRPWAGGGVDGPSVTAFFGVVELASPVDARAFFATTVQRWRRCDGQTLVLTQPGRIGETSSRITDVTVDRSVVSAVVHHDAGPPIQRAVGVASNCIVDVELSDVRGQSGGADGAVEVADVMLDKISPGG